MEQQKTFNFNLPSPYQTEMAELARRQRMAETLQQQAAEPVQKFGYGGIEVPISPLSGLAKALNSFTARQIEKDVLKEQKDLGERYRADQESDLQTLVEALKPKAGKPALTEYPSSGTAGGGEVIESPAVLAKPANVFDSSVFGKGVLKTPEMRNFAFQQYLTQQMPKQPKWEKAQIPQPDGSVSHGYVDVNAANPISTFIPGGIQPPSVHFANTGNAIVPINQTTGKPIENVSSIPIEVSSNTAAELKQRQEHFNNLSEYQRKQLQNEAARIGISAEDLFFNTGLRVGVPGARSSMAPASGPSANAQILPTPKMMVEALKQAPERENTLRDEFNALTKDFRTVQDAHTKIRNVANTGAGDMSLLYSYVKLLDPGSVVRESEFATAAASGSFGERVQGAMQRVISGQRLPPDLRNDFLREADNLYKSQQEGAKRIQQNYTDIAKRMNLDPRNIITDYTSPAGTALPPTSALKEGHQTVFANGQVWTLKNGKPVQVK